MHNNNPILDAANLPIILANLFGRLATNTLDGLPLGTVGDSPLGEVFLKVGVISGNTNSGGFIIPPYNEIDFTYVGSTNNVATQIFKSGATVVSTLTYTYLAAGAADNDKVTSIVQS